METRRGWLVWWSGVLAMVAFVHLMRALANLPVTLGTVAIPMWVSWVVFPVAGIASGWLLRRALEGGGRPWRGLSPPAMTSDPVAANPPDLSVLREISHACCGDHGIYHTVGEDDEAE